MTVPMDLGARVVYLSSPSPFEGVPTHLQAHLGRWRSGPANPCFETSWGTERLRMKRIQDFPQSSLPLS